MRHGEVGDAQLRALIDEELARLDGVRVTLQPEMIQQDRIEADVRATFSSSREAALARRYEAQSTRTFLRAIRELQAIEQGEANPEAPSVRQTLAPPAAAAAKVNDVVDAVEIRDPADDPPVAKPQRDHEFRVPLASDGITVEQASRELSYPHYDRPPTPHDMPLPPLPTPQPVVPRRFR